MTKQLADVKFTEVTPEVLEKFLATAVRRIVIAKAGYSVPEVTQLIKLVKERKINCDLYMEEGEKAVRYGFGTSEALPLLKENMDCINVQSVNQIRMALVIVDDTALVYAPNALSWEKAPEKLEFPNGFFGGKSIADTLFKQMGGEIVVLDIEERKEDDSSVGQERLFTIPVLPLPKKKPEQIRAEIEKTGKALKENPPVDPAVLRNTTFYRNKFKLLKMTMHGAKIKNKKLDLNPFNVMFPDTNNRLKASWHVLTSSDEQSIPSFREFRSAVEKDKALISFDAKRYGDLIRTKDIHDFEVKVCQHVTELTKKLLNINSNPVQARLPGMQGKTLDELLVNSRSALIEHLYSLAVREEACWDQLFSNDRSLQRKMKNSEISADNAVREAVESFVDFTLKFPEAEELIELINVNFDYYDVSNELLADSDFMKVLEGFDEEVREYNKGFEQKSAGFDN
jgi:hypothetical protein